MATLTDANVQNLLIFNNEEFQKQSAEAEEAIQHVNEAQAGVCKS